MVLVCSFANDDHGPTRLDPLWPEGQQPEIYLDHVHLTPLGRQALGGQAVPPVADPGLPDVRYFPATGHTLRGAFREQWQQRGDGPIQYTPLGRDMLKTRQCPTPLDPHPTP